LEQHVIGLETGRALGMQVFELTLSTDLYTYLAGYIRIVLPSPPVNGREQGTPRRTLPCGAPPLHLNASYNIA